ncbi:MAG TPA: energy transducer TonB [Thermoanaerobaculia bacterium]|nr:energy transducer TonB [Thermoanaerobaculia bacterium]
MKWTADLNHADKQLRAGKWGKGVKTAQNLIEEIRSHPTIGTGLAELLARSVALRAVGEAGLGDAEAAKWDGAAARFLGLHPTDIDFEAFGEAGMLVRSAVKPPAEESSDVLSAGGEVTRPSIRTKVNPIIPVADRAREIHGPAIVEAVIDEQGTPHRPRVLKSPSPRLMLATLEALRQWSFVPGSAAGKPVPVYYVLTIQY